jgi:formylglycine-generating enzyme required for sulfatase activity
MDGTEIFPQRLKDLGFDLKQYSNTEVIIPPLCHIEAGEFLMGSDPRRDLDSVEAERPQHWVSLPDYGIARFPVTVAEYALFVRSGGREPTPRDFVSWTKQLQSPTHPIVCVEWSYAVAYAEWLSILTGQRWRLPTEAEWEKAARWDTRGKGRNQARIYPWGDRFDKSKCNTNASNIRTTTEVGKYPKGSSPYGVQDMSGNVWEWTSSIFMPYPYDSTDGREDLSSLRNRVLRGGAWLLEPRVARTTSRNNEHPEHFAGYFYDVGFRLLREAD